MKRMNYFGFALIMALGLFFTGFGAFVARVDCSEYTGQELDECQQGCREEIRQELSDECMERCERTYWTKWDRQMNKIGNNNKATKRKMFRNIILDKPAIFYSVSGMMIF